MPEAVSEKTTIEVEKSTREKLKRIGKKGETYNQIILRLIEKESVVE
jgi:hypothetical protein